MSVEKESVVGCVPLKRNAWNVVSLCRRLTLLSPPSRLPHLLSSLRIVPMRTTTLVCLVALVACLAVCAVEAKKANVKITNKVRYY